MSDRCKCGHASWAHVLLPGHPDGVQECQADDCYCGKYQPVTDDGEDDYDWSDLNDPDRDVNIITGEVE